MGAEANESRGVHAARQKGKKAGDLPCLPLDNAKRRQPPEDGQPSRIQIVDRRKKLLIREGAQPNTWQRHWELRNALEVVSNPESVNVDSLRERVTPNQHANNCLPVLVARKSPSNTNERRYPSGSSSSSSSWPKRVRSMAYHVLPPSNTPSPAEAGSQPFPVSAPELSRGRVGTALWRVSSEQPGYEGSIFDCNDAASGGRTCKSILTSDGDATRGRHQQQRKPRAVIPPRGVDGLLARPAPSLDDMLSPSETSAVLENGISRRGAYLHRRREEEELLLQVPASKSLPEMSHSQEGGSGSKGSSSTISMSSIESSREGARDVAKEEVKSGGANRKGRPHQGTSNKAGRIKESASSSSGEPVSAAKKGGNKNQRCSYNNNSWNILKRKLARSHSGGVPQPPPIQPSTSSAKGRSGHRAAAAVHSRIPVSSPIPRISTKFDGLDTTLLKEAFAFAERVAREETEELGDERRRRSRCREGRSGGAGSLPLMSPVEHGEVGGVGSRRRTKSRGSCVVAGESEDWVRGLPISFERGPTLPSRQTIKRKQQQQQQQQQLWRHREEQHRQRFRGAAAATCAEKIRRRTHCCPNGDGCAATAAPRGARGASHQTTSSSSPSGSNGNASDQGGRKEQGAARARRGKPEWVKRTQELRPSGLDQQGRGGGADGKGTVLTTAEVVERFESGAGVAELRAELAASQASMGRSAHVLRQTAARCRGR